jgi:hypothetical protein
MLTFALDTGYFVRNQSGIHALQDLWRGQVARFPESRRADYARHGAEVPRLPPKLWRLCRSGYNAIILKLLGFSRRCCPTDAHSYCD